jgi:hypothetical protein
MKPALPGTVTAARPTPVRRYVLVAIVFIVVFAVLRSCFAPHENAAEKIARDVTVALQANDLATVQKYQNAETATQVTRAVVGRAADVLGPLGKLKRVKETTPDGSAPRLHQFTLTFDKGYVQETMKLDPDQKIVAFRYSPPTTTAP